MFYCFAIDSKHQLGALIKYQKENFQVLRPRFCLWNTIKHEDQLILVFTNFLLEVVCNHYMRTITLFIYKDNKAVNIIKQNETPKDFPRVVSNTYRVSSDKRPRCLFNSEVFRYGAYWRVPPISKSQELFTRNFKKL